MCRIFVYLLVLKKPAREDANLNKYNFNAYDTVIALILTQYLKERDYKEELERVLSGKEVNGPELSNLLNRSMAWASTRTGESPDPLMGEMIAAVKEVQQNFSGQRYVQSMDAGFAEFLDDLLNAVNTK